MLACTGGGRGGKERRGERERVRERERERAGEREREKEKRLYIVVCISRESPAFAELFV